MRIIKLSAELGFDSPDYVISFFERTLPKRFDGRFRITDRRIRADGLEIGEEVFFSFQGDVYYIARAASGRQDNHDEYSDDLPFFFQVNIPTLRRVSISLAEIERRLHEETNETKHIVQSRGWPEIQNQPFVNNLWRELVR